MGQYTAVDDESPPSAIMISIPIEKIGVYNQLTDGDIVDYPEIIQHIHREMEYEIEREIQKGGYVQYSAIKFTEARHYPVGGCDGTCPEGECIHTPPHIVDYGVWAWVYVYKIPSVFDEVLKNERKKAVQRHIMGIEEK